jgi:uncharacterized protein (UPF0335 family)
MLSSVITIISSHKRFKIEGSIMLTLKGLREKIESLESEKAELKVEVERLRKEAEGKAVGLECEVAVLREEAESLKKMLDVF